MSVQGEIVQDQRLNGGSTGYKGIIPRWPKGVSGNPGGRTKGPSVVHAIDRIMALSDAELAKFRPANQAEKIALARIKAAGKIVGGLADATFVTDRTDGPLKQQIEISTSDAAALVREAKTRFEFFLEYNARFSQYQQQIAEHFKVEAQSLPEFGVCSTERIIEIVLSQFPEQAHGAILAEIGASEQG